MSSDDSRLPPFTPKRAARDTGEMVRDVGHDLEKLREATAGNLARIREDIGFVKLTAERADLATKPKPIAWVRVFPICLTLLGLSASVLLTMDRKIDRQEFLQEIHVLQNQVALFERELRDVKTSAEQLREVIATVRAALLQRDEERRKR